MIDYLILAGGYLFLLLTSGLVVHLTLSAIAGEPLKRKIGKELLDTGFIIGKCENILILSFMVLEAYTAIALVFAAKAIIRSEDIRKNSLYFLAGTMVNVTYSTLLGVVLNLLTRS